MLVRIRDWCFGLPLLAVLFSAVSLSPAPLSLHAADPLAGSSRHGFHVVSLFDALADNRVEATVVAGDAKRLMVQVHNRTDRPLSVALPKALAARPVLAQFGPVPGPFAPGGGRGLGPGLGPAAGFPNAGANPGAGAGNQGVGFGTGPGNGNPQPGAAGAFFNVLPGRVVKRRFDCVCLEHGKPDPTKKIAYELAPLADIAPDPKVAELLDRLARGRVQQTTAQLAVWHIANQKSWRELASTPYITANGRRRAKYSSQEILAARRLVADLPSSPPSPVQPSLVGSVAQQD